MGHNVYFADLDLTPAQNVVLERGVPNELLVNFARILDFIEVISAIRLFQNIDSTKAITCFSKKEASRQMVQRLHKY